MKRFCLLTLAVLGTGLFDIMYSQEEEVGVIFDVSVNKHKLPSDSTTAKAQITRQSSGKVDSVKIGATIYEGDSFTTEEGVNASIKFFCGDVLKVKDATVVQITRDQKVHVEMGLPTLEKASLWTKLKAAVHLKKTKCLANHFELKTVNANGGVFGTEVFMTFFQDSIGTPVTEFYVLKGVATLSAKRDSVIIGASVDVLKGQAYRVQGYQSPSLLTGIELMLLKDSVKKWPKTVKPNPSWFKPWYLIPLAIPPVIFLIREVPPPGSKAKVNIIVDVPPGN